MNRPDDARSRRSILRVLVLLTLVTSCGATATEPLPPGGHHVLFIGNSLTYVNDLPGMVAAIAASAGDTIRVATVAKPDFALIDHLNGGSDAVARIKDGGWEYVVLQQGPSSLVVNQDSLKLWTRGFDPYVRAAGATPALLMVWPSSDRAAFFDDVRKSYQNAALAVHGAFYPAGEAWLRAWAANPALPLYGDDGYHPSVLGTYVAALVVAECVTKRDARSFPPATSPSGIALGVDTATIRLLQRAAHQAIVDYHGC